MSDVLQDRLGPSLSQLVSGLGARVIHVEDITVLPDKGARQTFRLWFDDGRTLKGRRFRTRARAEVAWRILSGTEAPFLGRAIAHEGDAMLEEWVEGETLVQGRVDHRLVREAGRILGALHNMPPPSTADIHFQPMDGAGWVRKTMGGLRTLRDRGLIAPAPAGVLTDLMMSHLPAAVPIGVVHRDLCPENLVTDTGGRLISVDNGSMTIGAIDHDLCRVWYRWPMSVAEQAAFNAGYREHRAADALGLPPLFWVVVVVVNSARIRLGRSVAAASAASATSRRIFLGTVVRLAGRRPGAGIEIVPGFPDQYQCVFGFRGLRIALHSHAAAPLAWLEEFFGPFLAAKADDAPHSNVTLTLDDRRYTRLVTEPDEPGGQPIDGFALDGAFERLALWRDAPGERLLHDVNAQAFLVIGAGHRTIQIVAQRDHARLRVSLMRVVRELATLQALDRRDLLVHGATAVSRGRAIVIAGPKQSGKTTMLLGLLQRRQARYLSNDRVVIDLSGTSPLAHGVPTIANVRADAFSYLPSLDAPVAAPSQRFYLTAEESRSGSPIIEPTKRAVPPMSPAEFCRWLGVEAEAAAPVGMVVFPRVDPTIDRFVLRNLSAVEAADRIYSSLFSSGPAGPVSEAFRPGWEGTVPSHKETLDACRRLAGNTTAWECRIGPRAFQGPDVWDAIAATGLH